MSDNKTGWIKYEYWAKGTHSTDHYLFIGLTLDDMDNDDVFDYIVDHEGNWARFAERFRAEWEVHVIPPKEVVEYELKMIDSRMKSLNSYKSKMEKFL